MVIFQDNFAFRSIKQQEAEDWRRIAYLLSKTYWCNLLVIIWWVNGIVVNTCLRVSLHEWRTSSEISKHVDVSPLLLHSWDSSSNVLQVPLGLYLELTGQIQQGRDPGRLRTCWSEHISHLEDPAVSQDRVAGKRMSGLMCLVCLLAKLDTYTATLSLC